MIGVHESALLARIGNTPLFPLQRVAPLPAGVRLSLKAEWYNPGGSVKDRAAAAIVERAVASGQLHDGIRLLDSTSGNTGIAYAMLGAALGFGVTLCLPLNANLERQRTLRAFGAEIVGTDPAEGSDGAIVRARELAATGRYFYADQYSNDANWQAHVTTTGPEIVAQTGGDVTHVIATLGTTGTCIGLGRYFRQTRPQTQVIAVQPDSPFHGLEGLKHLDTAIVPRIYDASVPHAQRTCGTEAAYAMARRLARCEGLFVGISTGAAVAVATALATELTGPAHIVVIAPDGGTRYLSEHFWDAVDDQELTR